MLIFKIRSFQRSVLLLISSCLIISCNQKTEEIKEAAFLIDSLMTHSKAAGLAISVGIKGDLLWSEGFGYADIEQRVPVKPNRTRFRVGSIAKPMTAAAIALLYQQGKLDLDAPVQKYLATFPEKQGTISTRLLAGHLAGIRHYKNNEYLSQKYYPTVQDGLKIFSQDTLLFSPGTRFSYSSYGFNLLSVIIERASGDTYLNYMKNNIFKPLNMNNTIADHIDSIIVNRGRYYGVNNDKLVNAPPVDNSYKWAGGGFLSTSEDLLRFGFAHLDNTLLKKETISLLWTSQRTSSGEETGYGMGWAIGKDGKGRLWVGHNGGSVGGTTRLRIYPQEKFVLVIIANISSLDYSDTPDKIADIFLTK